MQEHEEKPPVSSNSLENFNDFDEKRGSDGVTGPPPPPYKRISDPDSDLKNRISVGDIIEKR